MEIWRYKKEGRPEATVLKVMDRDMEI